MQQKYAYSSVCTFRTVKVQIFYSKIARFHSLFLANLLQKYFKYDAIGLEDIQVSYNAEHILKMIFETLEAKEIFYEMNGEKKYLNKETIEILRMGIYHSFDVVKYLLGDGT